MNSSKNISDLDSNLFGFKVAKINTFHQNPVLIVDSLKKENVRLIISKINCEDLDLINKLESIGFQIKDFQITYRYQMKDINFSKEDLHSDFMIRNANENDIVTLADIAQMSFNNYGHYFADKNLDQSRCNEIYKDWTKRSCINKDVADLVLVADYQGEIAGFLSFKSYTDNNNRYAAGGLGAVTPKYRDKNVFRLLAKMGLLWGKAMGLDWEEHNVLTTNYSVNRSFAKIGFKIFKSFVTLHYWCR